jgi:hypothetical protein
MIINKKQVRSFYRYLKNNQLPKNMRQEAAGHGKFYNVRQETAYRWTADLWSLEVCKAFLIGIEKYREENVPEKYRKNEGHTGNHVIRSYIIKENLLNILADIKDDCDVLAVCEVGRGLDILIANMVKKWKKIICYDQVHYNEYLKYFKNIDFHIQATNRFLEIVDEYIPEKCIMISHGSKFRDWDNLREKNIIHLIVDGKLKW